MYDGKLRSLQRLFVPGTSVLSNSDVIVPWVTGNYSPVQTTDESRCSRARSIKTSQRGTKLIRARSLTTSEENSSLEEESSSQRGCSATQNKEKGGESGWWSPSRVAGNTSVRHSWLRSISLFTFTRGLPIKGER